MTKTNDGDRNVVCESNNSKMEISKLCLLFQLVEIFYQCADMVIGMVCLISLRSVYEIIQQQQQYE